METNAQQLTAEPNTNVTTDAGLSAENRAFYDRALIEEAEPNLVHASSDRSGPFPKTAASRSSSGSTRPCPRP